MGTQSLQHALLWLSPYFGVPYFDHWGIIGGHTSAYRWHINDPIVFNTGIKVTMEHFGWISPDENPDYKKMSWNERQDDYSSVAYWYQTGKATFAARAPDARERNLPNLDRVIAYAQVYSDALHHGEGEVSTQRLDFFETPQLFYQPAKAEGAWVEIPFEFTKKEPLRLLLKATKAEDYGEYKVSLNGVKLAGTVNFYSAKLMGDEVPLLDFWPEPGKYTLRLECVGKSRHSTGYNLGLESVRLRERRPRVMQMGHDKDKDWRKGSLLYSDE